jgi:hypothetical protein
MAAVGAGGAGMLALAGCGWTARDDFAANREVVLHAQSGDGSHVSSGWDPRQVAQRTSQTTQVPSMRDGD